MTGTSQFLPVSMDLAEYVNKESLPIRAAYAHILVKALETKAMTEGGLHIPEVRKADEDLATVVAQVLDIGPDAFTGYRFPNGNAFPVKVGDWIIFSMYKGLRVTYGGDEYRLITDDSIIAVIQGDPQKVSRKW